MAVLEVPSSLLMVSLDSDSRRRASLAAFCLFDPMRFVDADLDGSESDVMYLRWIRVGFGSASSC